MNVILLFLTVILCSPNNNAQAMMSGLEEIGIDKKLQRRVVVFEKFIIIGSTAFLNSFLIPTLVYNLSEMMHFQTKSRKDQSKLLKYFLYLFINAIILPLAQIS